MVEAFQWYSILSIVTSSLAVGIAAFVLKRTPNRGAGNTFVTAMVFFLLASILAYLFRSGYAYYGDNEGQWLFFGRIFYFFHMLAVGYTAAFVGSYFYGFPIMRRRMVNLFLQISILVVAIVVSSLVTEAEHEVLPDGTDVGVVVENLTAVWSLAVFATIYMSTALAAILRTLQKNKDPIVRKQALVMLAGILVHGAGAESYAYLRGFADAYPPPILTATALIMASTFAVAIIRYRMFVVTPRGEQAVPLPRKFDLRPGRAYLVRERKPDLAFRAVSEAAHRGEQALIVSRLPPATVREDFDLDAAPVLWLTSNVGQNHVPPTHLDILEDLVGTFVAEADKPVLGLEGIEYLSTYHEFGRILQMLHKVRDRIAAKNGILLVSVNAALLDEPQLALLDREFESLPVPPNAEAVEDVFLIHDSGLLIHHAARRLKPGESDRDLMAGMLTAIMNFARVSFSEGRGELRRLELGDKTVLLERSRQLILAVVFAGKTQGELDREMRAFLWRAEQKYADRLADWSGKPEEVHELTAMTDRMVTRLLA